MKVDLSIDERETVDDMQRKLTEALGGKLDALVLYGPATWGDRADGEVHLLIVLADAEVATLDALAGPLAFWRRNDLPVPRLVTRAELARMSDVFPLEIADLGAHREVLVGADPVAGVVVDDEHIRLQCEREITEKLLRLREGYAECGGKRRTVRRLLVESFPDFCLVLRGALRLYGVAVPDRGIDVARAFCRAADLDDRAFVEVDALRRSRGEPAPIAEIFARYYAVLARAAGIIDGLSSSSSQLPRKGATP